MTKKCNINRNAFMEQKASRYMSDVFLKKGLVFFDDGCVRDAEG
jgi:hypothetical protein